MGTTGLDIAGCEDGRGREPRNTGSLETGKARKWVPEGFRRARSLCIWVPPTETLPDFWPAEPEENKCKATKFAVDCHGSDRKLTVVW